MSVETIIWINKFIGLSTDSKPTDKIRVGSTFYETDTRTPYVWTGSEWVQDYREASSGEGGSTSPGGSDTQVQFNDGGAFAGNSVLTFNKTTGLLSVTALSANFISSVWQAPKALFQDVYSPGVLIAPFLENVTAGANSYLYLRNNDPLAAICVHLFFVQHTDGMWADGFFNIPPGGTLRVSMAAWSPDTVISLMVIPVDAAGAGNCWDLEGWVEYHVSASEYYTYPLYRVDTPTFGVVGGGAQTVTFTSLAPTTLKIAGFRNATERDAMILSIARLDGDLSGASQGALGILTFTQVDSAGNTTWTTGSLTATGVKGTLASAFSKPGGLAAPSDQNTYITVACAAGVSIVGVALKLAAGQGSAQGVAGFGASLMQPTVYAASDTLVLAAFTPTFPTYIFNGKGEFTSGLAVSGTESLGDELIVNGAFDHDDHWTKGSGWTISANAAHTDGTAASLSQALTGVTSGKLYKIQVGYTPVSWNLNIHVKLGSRRMGTLAHYVPPWTGTATFYAVAEANNPTLYLTTINGADDITSVSVKEVSGGAVKTINEFSIGRSTYDATLSGAMSEEAYLFRYTQNKAAGRGMGLHIHEDFIASAGTGYERGSYANLLKFTTSQAAGAECKVYYDAGNYNGFVVAANAFAVTNGHFNYDGTFGDAAVFGYNSLGFGLDNAFPGRAALISEKKFSVFNAFTSMTNNESVGLDFASNVARLFVAKGSGGGTQRELGIDTGYGTMKVFTYSGAVADDAAISLPAITNAGRLSVQVGNLEEWVECLIDNDGDVTLVQNSSNVVAGADTDTKLCIGTAATQEPLFIKNRLGASKNVNIILWYN